MNAIFKEHDVAAVERAARQQRALRKKREMK